MMSGIFIILTFLTGAIVLYRNEIAVGAYVFLGMAFTMEIPLVIGTLLTKGVIQR
jgi:hypothetical protein